MKENAMPSRQGDLDSLCGFYSIANMMYWLYGRKIKRKTLFKVLLQCYSQHWSIIECLTSGMDSSQMNVLLQYLSQCRYRKYPVIISQPFSTQTSLSKLKILRTIRSYLENNDSRAIIMRDQFHWSVIIHADSQNLYFFDSGSYRKKTFGRYSLRDEEGKLQLYPDGIYFIECGDANL
ncbi:hypothetical protein PXY67_003426 [Salmonella enterica]|nr:hypothetical protein [Salmonella enterica]EDW0581183.1 hypothetical protein [Salmonella enterica subsp. enterica serovar Poona]EBD0565441.1 hypothetical protein [Salmonella enterica]EBD1341633.1 hypothetical protein [Salmonella enterica]EBI2536813.1 hypothetical protein [Salmonella enterica]